MVAYFRGRERKKLQKEVKESVKKEPAKDVVQGEMGLKGGRGGRGGSGRAEGQTEGGGVQREGPGGKNQVTDIGRKTGFGVPAQAG